MRLPAFAPAFASALVLFASAAGAEDPRVAAGRTSYIGYCASCHGVTGAGDGPLREHLRIPPTDLTQIAASRNGVFPHPLIVEIIDGRRRVRAHGPRDMPVWGRRIGRDVAAGTSTETAIKGEIMLMIEFLKSIQVSEARKGS